jgi:CBS domain-containing protein
MPEVVSQPAASLILQLSTELSEHPPFAQMQPEHVRHFIAQSEQRYYAPGEQLMSPADGPVQSLLFIRRGAVTGTQGLAQLTGGAFLYEAGDTFPVSAAVANRAVTATYKASEDCFALALPVAAMHKLAEQSPPFADFLNRRVQQFLSLSQKALQEQYASRALAEQSMETPLADIAKREPVACRVDTPLRDALARMHEQRIGSMLITNDAGAALGILTRYDILGRVTLAGVSLDAPMGSVMVSPVQTLSTTHTAQDAALLMSRLHIRHVPVTREENGVHKVVGIVSERDLFAIQRLSLQHISNSIRSASSIDALKKIAPDIRRFAERLLGQGIQSRQLTSLVSHLNDILTQRILDVLADAHGLARAQACWIALGSEGREEQTIATDQDNALILADEVDEATRERWLALALEANETLDSCGYPLCVGNIMSSNADLCLRLKDWRARFEHWIGMGDPEDLLNASIFFDLRPLWGQQALASSLREVVTQLAPQKPRFLKLLALNALERSVPITWTGAIDTDEEGYTDLKLRGTAIVVDAARLYSLAHGITATNTRERLQAMGEKLGAKEREYQSWIVGFEFLQTLRLRIQIDGKADPDRPNSVIIRKLNTIDRRILKETLRVVDELQQRMKLDYER